MTTGGRSRDDAPGTNTLPGAVGGSSLAAQGVAAGGRRQPLDLHPPRRSLAVRGGDPRDGCGRDMVSFMPWTDILTSAIVIAVVVLLWRDTNDRIAALAATVGGIDRRLATLEGRITGWQDYPITRSVRPDRS